MISLLKQGKVHTVGYLENESIYKCRIRSYFCTTNLYQCCNYMLSFVFITNMNLVEIVF